MYNYFYYNTTNMKYAIQLRTNGSVLDYSDSLEEIQQIMASSSHNLEIVDTTTASVIKVTYTELGGPNGYGHSEISFITYGGIKKCARNLIKWMQETARIFGPDAREIKDFFKYCSLEVNHQDKSNWLREQVKKLDIHTIYA